MACYAVAVALNGFLPANLGTWVMLLMFTTLIAGATFAMVFSGLIVEKIPFSVFNVALYLYLFFSVSGSFSSWSGGKALVESSYEDAKVKSRELKAKRKRS